VSASTPPPATIAVTLPPATPSPFPATPPPARPATAGSNSCVATLMDLGISAAAATQECDVEACVQRFTRLGVSEDKARRECQESAS
jgi:hypothetical protein